MSIARGACHLTTHWSGRTGKWVWERSQATLFLLASRQAIVHEEQNPDSDVDILVEYVYLAA